MGVPPRDSCAVILSKWEGDLHQVFLVQRSIKQKFFPGFFAFPGGATEPEDRTFHFPESEDELSTEIATAVREIFEETGVLLANSASIPYGKLPSLRQDLLDGKISFREILEKTRTQMDPTLLHPLGRKTTPPFSPLRFQTRFFWAPVPSGQEPKIWPGELKDGLWIAPEEALKRWKCREILIAPPVIVLLKAMTKKKKPSEFLEDLKFLDDEILKDYPFRITIDPSCEMVPLLTPTVPPAAYTNCFFIGQRDFYILDPGPVDPEEQDYLCRALEARIQEGKKPLGILVSHYHHDHIGAVETLRERFSLEVYSHPSTVTHLEAKGMKMDVHHFLKEGQKLPGIPEGPLEVLYTPGHSPDHCCFFLREGSLLFGGDMVSTLSSVIIPPPPKGDLRAYMASLDRLLQLNPRWLFPSHGPPTAQGTKKIEGYIRHRQQREVQLMAAIEEGNRRVEDLLMAIYGDEIDEKMYTFAGYNIKSGLHKLIEEGKVRETGDEYFLS